MTETKSRFRAVAIHGKCAKNGSKYARDLAFSMNRLIEDGYQVQVQEQKFFTLLLGVYAGESRSPGPPGLRLARAVAAEDEMSLSPRTQELLNRFKGVLHGRKLADGLAEVKKQAGALVRDFQTEEVVIAAKELDAELAQHDDCSHAAPLRAIIEALRVVVQTQLQ